jgi:hypothetical protein
MTFQLGICVIVAVLLLGGALCTLAAIDHQDDDQGNKYGFRGVGMMVGAIAVLFFVVHLWA